MAPNSLASKIGLVAEDKILAVNGQNIRDIIDFSFALADERLDLLIERQDGSQKLISVRKAYDQALGVEFESAVFDKISPCANKCIFCFIEQMPAEAGLRPSLYIKDDDYRLSFLNGNFITLTNLTPKDLARIRQFHLSPLYVSVHTANGPLRAKMMNNPKAALIMEQLNQLIKAGIDIHAQVVLCPGINDGEELDNTIHSLFSLYPSVLSLAIVPVGLTNFRDNCPPLSSFTKKEAQEVITLVEKRQQTCRQASGVSFVYLADEFYLIAEQDFPPAKHYDGFPQLENGVGIARKFIDEWESYGPDSAPQASGQPDAPSFHIDIVCGLSAEPILQKLLSKSNPPNVSVRLRAVENTFFGKNITVTGLLTGMDILKALTNFQDAGDGIILPGVALKEGDTVFLDGMTIKDLETALGRPVRIAYTASDLRQAIKIFASNNKEM